MQVNGQIHFPAALPPGKEPLVSIAYEAGWAPESGLDAVEKWKILPLPEIERRPSSP
jgi:hypothetical protein